MPIANLWLAHNFHNFSPALNDLPEGAHQASHAGIREEAHAAQNRSKPAMRNLKCAVSGTLVAARHDGTRGRRVPILQERSPSRRWLRCTTQHAARVTPMLISCAPREPSNEATLPGGLGRLLNAWHERRARAARCALRPERPSRPSLHRRSTLQFVEIHPKQR